MRLTSNHLCFDRSVVLLLRIDMRPFRRDGGRRGGRRGRRRTRSEPRDETNLDEPRSGDERCEEESGRQEDEEGEVRRWEGLLKPERAGSHLESGEGEERGRARYCSSVLRPNPISVSTTFVPGPPQESKAQSKSDSAPLKGEQSKE